MTMTRSSILVCAAIAALAMTAACHDSNDMTNAGTGPPSSLVSSASVPANGDGTITASGTLRKNFNGSGFDTLTVMQQLGQTTDNTHGVTVTWDTGTHVLKSVEHWWGDSLIWAAYTTCGLSDVCDASTVAIDFAGRKVTLTGLVLPGSQGSQHGNAAATSTLDGTIRW